MNGGTLTPGASIGTVNVAGDFALNAGSNLVMEVTDGAADRINVAGAVTIDGATLTVCDLVGGPAPMNSTLSYVLISNDGSDAITGSRFASVIDELAFLTPSITLTGGDGNDVALSLAIAAINLPTAATKSGASAGRAGLYAPRRHACGARLFQRLPAARRRRRSDRLADADGRSAPGRAGPRRRRLAAISGGVAGEGEGIGAGCRRQHSRTES